jgi:hypothetical protein
MSRHRRLTPEEERTEEQAAIAAYVQAHVGVPRVPPESDLCPECSGPIERTGKIVPFACCVYVYPCGHRLYCPEMGQQA